MPLEDTIAELVTASNTLTNEVRLMIGQDVLPQPALPGQEGFGVGICPGPLPAGMSQLPGTRDVSSDNYGNYRYTDGSIMVWIPAFYYKYGTGANGLALNQIAIEPFSGGAYSTIALANAAGYALHRAFYDAGAVQSGVFVDKYQCSNNGGIASSHVNANPLSTASANNPISGLVNAPVNNYGGAILAAKSRGANFFCSSRFIFSALAMLSLAHGQSASSALYCAWYDASGITNYPKGNNNNAFGDANDAAISYISSGYLNAGKTGTANLFARTTHNGQNCGVADLNGNMWEINPGFSSDGVDYYLLKTSVKMADLTGGNALATDAWGVNGLAANYTNIGASYGALWATAANRTVGIGSPTSQAFSADTAGNAWAASGAGIPLVGGVGGSNAFGNDALWDYKPNELCPIAGGGWLDAGTAGVWALALSHVRGSSYNDVGFRSALYL